MNDPNDRVELRDPDDVQAVKPPLAVRMKRRLGRLVRRTGRLARLPIDCLLLVMHGVVLNALKTRLLKRGCQIRLGEDERSLCRCSSWYGNPRLLKLLCPLIRPNDKAPTGHCRCSAEPRETPAYWTRSGLTLVVLLGVIAGVGLFGHRQWQRLTPAAAAGGPLVSVPQLFEEATALYDEGRYFDAAERCENIVGRDGDHVAAWLLLGRCYEHMNSEAEAVRAYEEATELDPKQAEAHARLAWLCLARDETQQARQRARLALQHGTQPGPMNAVLALCAVEDGELERARKLLNPALEDAPDLPVTRYVHFMVLTEEGQAAAAAELGRKLLSDNEYGVRAGLRLAELHAKQQEPAQAEKVLERVLAEHDVPEAHLALFELRMRNGMATKALGGLDALMERINGNQERVEHVVELLRLNGERDRALRVAQSQLRRFPQSTVLQTAAAEVHYQRRLYRQTKEYCEAVLARDPKNKRALTLMARCHFDQREYEKAIAVLQRLLAVTPDDADVHSWLGEAHRRLKRLEPALANWQKAIDLDDEQGYNFLGAGKTYIDMKEWDKAKAALTRALELRPELWEARTLLGVAHYRLGETEQAKACYEEVLQKSPPNTVQAANNLAAILVEEGKDLARAERLARGAARSSRGNPFVVDTLAWALFKQEKLPEAEKLLRRAVKDAPESPVLRYHYGVVLMEQKQEGAAEQLAAALKLEPDFEFAEDARKRLAALEQGNE